MSESLADRIVCSVKRGKIPNQFRVADVRRLFSHQFSENHIRTVLPNYAPRGDMVIRARQRARFRRLSKGLYEIL
jgi:hypothetical protein